MIDTFLLLGSRWVQIFLNPLWYIALSLSLFLVLRSTIREWHQYGRPMISPFIKIGKMLVCSLAGSFFLTLFFSLFSFQWSQKEIFGIWLLTLLLFPIRSRLADLSYSVGIIGITHLIIQKYFSEEIADSVILQVFADFTLRDWLLFVACSQFLKSLLIRLDGIHLQKLFLHKIEGEQAVNGFRTHAVWPLGITVFTGAEWAIFPVASSYTSYNLSKPSQQNIRLTSTINLVYALCFLLFTWWSNYSIAVLWFTTFLSLLGSEVLYQWKKRQEQQNRPIFISDEKGLKVLAVVPNSPASRLGIKAGDIIHRVNGKPIQTELDLRTAVSQSPICRMEILDEQMDTHLIQKVIDEEDEKNLGIIGAIPFRKISRKRLESDQSASSI